jgi:DNA-binding transcriptional MerR regulator/effector-binding domain-containing protein
MINKKGYLTTGEFAKLCNVSKHTLFHYNDVDVFVPQYIDENGYRYYHVLQYDNFCTITQLRTIGMSLTEIKEYLMHRSPSKLIELCIEQESVIDKQIKQLRLIKSSLCTTRLEVKQAITAHNKFFVQKEPQEHLLLSDVVNGVDDVEMTHIFGNLVSSMGNATFRTASGMIHHTCDIEQENYDMNCMFYLKASCNKKTCDCTIKPKGDYLVTYHFGRYSTLNDTYRELLAYAAKSSLLLGESFYDEMVIGDWAVMDAESYVMKVSVPLITN